MDRRTNTTNLSHKREPTGACNPAGLDDGSSSPSDTFRVEGHSTRLDTVATTRGMYAYPVRQMMFKVAPPSVASYREEDVLIAWPHPQEMTASTLPSAVEIRSRPSYRRCLPSHPTESSVRVLRDEAISVPEHRAL